RPARQDLRINPSAFLSAGNAVNAGNAGNAGSERERSDPFSALPLVHLRFISRLFAVIFPIRPWMLLFLYNLLLPLFLLASFPVYLRRMIRRGGYARNFLQRFGFFSRRLRS